MTITDPALIRTAVELWAETGHRTTLPARGFSMWPWLRSGDLLSIRHGGRQPEIGQILVVFDGGKAVAHRVIGKRACAGAISFRTKGDTCLTADRIWVGADQIIGVVDGVVEADVVMKRWGIDGPWGLLLARVSRAQGILCAPLGSIVAWLRGRPGRVTRGGP